MNHEVSKIRQLLLKAKPLDLSQRPTTLFLRHGETWHFLPFILGAMYFGYETFNEWNNAGVYYDSPLIIGFFLFMGISEFRKALDRYDITIGTDDVCVEKKHLFTKQKWNLPLSEFQTLEINYFPGEWFGASIYSVDLTHPDPNKTLPLAAARQEAVARGQLELLNQNLRLPIVDKISPKEESSGSMQKPRVSVVSVQKAVLPLLLLGVMALPLGYLGWMLLTSPMKSISCTVTKHEVTDVEQPSPEGPQKNLTIYYEYQYRGQDYVSGSNIGDFHREEKLQKWLDKSPVGTQPDCWVDSRDPTKIMEYPFPNSWIYGSVLGGVGLMAMCGLWALQVFFPLGFGGETKTTFERITQFRTKNRIGKRFQQSIKELKKLGFQGHCFYREILGPFSLISSFLVFLAMYEKKEVLEIRSPLRFATGYPLLDLPRQGTFAVVYVLETKFLTLFTDGTTLITGTEGRIPSFVDENFKVHRQGTTQTLMAAWSQHQIRVDAFKEEGKHQKEDIHFSDYTDILTKLEKIYLNNNMFQSA